MTERILERLAAANIQLLPVDLDNHFVFERDGFIALVERRRDNSFGRAGSAGLMTEKGLAPLVWRGDVPYFVAKGLPDQQGAQEQVDLLRRFQADLESALAGPVA